MSNDKFVEKVRLHRPFGQGVTFKSKRIRVAEQWKERYIVAFDELDQEGAYPITATKVKKRAMESGHDVSNDRPANITLWLKEYKRYTQTQQKYDRTKRAAVKEKLVQEIKELWIIGFQDLDSIYTNIEVAKDWAPMQIEFLIVTMKKEGLIE